MSMPSNSSPILSGERAVVLIFLLRVIFSIPLPLFVEGFGLCLLAIAALSLEINIDGSDAPTSFSARVGASSGILLGTVTAPAVLVARLTQQSRVLSLPGDMNGELTHFKLQYWAASFCGLGVLTFLHRRPSQNDETLNFRTILIALHAMLGCARLAALSYSASDALTTLLFVLFLGFCAARLTIHIMELFPRCASLGEAVLVASGLVLYLGDAFASTISSVWILSIASVPMTCCFLPVLLPQISLLPFFPGRHAAMRRDEAHTVVQGLVAGFLLISLCLKHAVAALNACAFPGRRREVLISTIFVCLVGFVTVVAAPSWMRLVHDFGTHPYAWIAEFVFVSEPARRVSLCVYWMAVTCASAVRFYRVSRNSTVQRIILRKYYHLIAVLMFLPPLLVSQMEFLKLSLGVALAGFLALEIIRVHRIWPLGWGVHRFMNAFTDHRDSDLIIVSHFSLLLGCALPIWMSSSRSFNDRPLAPFAGIISLGIGDTVASVVGHKYGVLRWSETNKKTIEGTAAGIACVLASCTVMFPLLAPALAQRWTSLVVAVTVTCLLEAHTAQLDNAFIPLVFYTLLSL